ncbi:MAG: glycosyltransferase family 39 protein [Gammaproteobacteria bacterium]|nr:glycosyltransferase family 39 protein [Gammaproteobacteria bacterium]
MAVVPLNDPTESRYGEMARKMVATQDWVTLWHDVGVPFWGKPPLSIWLGALSMQGLGVSAFSVRLPALCMSIVMLMMMWMVTKRYRGVAIADVSVVVLASSFLFYLDAGTIMTDPALLFGLFLSQVTFWHALQRHSRVSGYLFFIGIAIGLLAKGPIILVLLGGCLGWWLTVQKKWTQCWRQLPWVSGSLLMLALVLPWYVLAEMKTPGFLQYFIVGEHVGRFLQSSWHGDKYGLAHAQLPGMIWLYVVMGLLPWMVWVGWCGAQKKGRSFIKSVFKQDKMAWMQYWLICFLFPSIFFTFSSNLIYPYMLPVAPAFAMLFAECWVLFKTTESKEKQLLGSASIMGIIFFTAGLLFLCSPQYVSQSQDRVVSLWQTQADSVKNPLVYLRWKLDFSAPFYSQGRVVYGLDLPTICPQIQAHQPVYLVVQDTDLAQLAQRIQTSFQVVGQVKRLKTSVYLVRVVGLPC